MADLENLPRLYIRGCIVSKEDAEMYAESFSASDVVDFLNMFSDEPEIVVEISSDGGSVSEGKEIFTRLRQSGKKITTITYKAKSIATLLMLVGQKRLIVEGADFLIHPARIFGEDLAGPLLSEDLIKIGQEIAVATEEILDIYCKVLGEDRRTALLVAMAKDTNLGAREAIKLGFANGYYKKATVEASSTPSILITNHLQQLIKNKMADKVNNDDLLKKIEDRISNGFKSITKFLTSKAKMFAVVLDDDRTVEVTPANPEMPEELLNGKVYEVDETGTPTTTPVADGTYTTKEGTSFTVTAGVITEVIPAVDAKKLEEEKKALKEANQKLTEQVAALEAEKVNSAKAIEDTKQQMKKELDDIKMAFTEFKNAVPGDKSDKKEDPKNQLEDFSKMTTAQKVRALSKQRAAEDLERKQLLNSIQ